LWAGTTTEGFATLQAKTYTAGALAASFEGITSGTSAVVYIKSIGAAEPGLLVRGATSQTANLQEWQNSSGTVLARIDANGLISLPGGSWHHLNGVETWYKNSVSFYQKGPSHTFRRQNDENIFVIDANANLEIRNSASVPAANSGIGGYLYVEAGALKFRGSSGTVTTIASA
jgi:hypothetical protein